MESVLAFFKHPAVGVGIVIAAAFGYLLATHQHVNRQEDLQHVDGLVLTQGEDYRDPQLNALMGQAAAAMRAGNVPKAKQIYRRVVDRFPQVPAGYTSLAACYGYEDNVAKEREYYLRALRVDHHNEPALTGMGWIHLDDGNPQAALNYFVPALEHAREKSPAHYNLARAYERLGNSEEALFHYQKVIELSDQSPLAEDARGRMRELN